MSLDFETFCKHCEMLKSAGKTVTLKNLRDSLGGGSMSTLSPLLKDWKKAQKAQTQENADGIPQSLIETLTKAIQTTLAETVNKKTQELQATIQNQEEDNTACLQELAEKNDALTQLQNAFNKLQAAKSELQGAHDTIQKHAQDLQQKLDVKTKELEDLRSEYQSSELVNKENQELRQTNGSLQDKVTQLTTRLDEKEKQLNDKAEGLRNLEADLRVKISEADRCKDLENIIIEKNTEIAALKNKLETRETEILKLTEERAMAQTEVKEAEKRISDLQAQLKQQMDTNSQIAQNLRNTNEKVLDAINRRPRQKSENQENTEKTRADETNVIPQGTTGKDPKKTPSNPKQSRATNE